MKCSECGAQINTLVNARLLCLDCYGKTKFPRMSKFTMCVYCGKRHWRGQCEARKEN